jgi:uncharacterized protein YunC (DUF1805 family)
MDNKENFDVAIVEEKIKGMRQMVEGTVVNSQESLAAVADYIKGVKTLGKLIRSEMEKYTKPAQEIINNARAKFLPYEQECIQAEKVLKQKAGAYMDEVEAERKRKEESIANRMDKGQLKEDTALRKMEEIGEEQKTVRTENGAKLTRKIIKTVKITNPDLVPDEYWVLDEVKIRKVALAGVEIPGVEVVEEKTTSL